MKSVKLLFTLVATMLVVGQVWGQSTLTLTLSSGDGCFSSDAVCLCSGNQCGDGATYARFSGSGTRSFQIQSPGEGITKTINSDGFFNIRPTGANNNITIDRSRILNFNGTVNGLPRTITARALVLNAPTVSPNSGNPGSQVRVTYKTTSAGSFPSPGVIGFTLQIFVNGSWQTMPNVNPQYTTTTIPCTTTPIPLESANGTAGGDRVITATIPPNLAAGTYPIRVTTTGLSSNVISGSATFTVNIPYTITTGNVSGAICAGANFSVPFTTSTTSFSPVYNVQLINASNQVVTLVNSYRGPSPIPAQIPANTPSGRYRVRVDNTGFFPTVTGSSSNEFTVSAPSTLNISLTDGTATFKGEVFVGGTASISLRVSSSSNWSVSYRDDILGSNVPLSNTPTPAPQRWIYPGFQTTGTRTYTEKDLTGFTNTNGCPGTISGTAALNVKEMNLGIGNLSTSGICPGGEISAQWSINGEGQAQPQGKFVLELLETNGNFKQELQTSGSPTVDGNGNLYVAINAANTQLKATVPTTVPEGQYKLRVAFLAPNGSFTRRSGASAATFTISRPTQPSVSNPAAICQGQPAPTLSAQGSNLVWYNSNNERQNGTPTPPNDRSSTWFVASNNGACESNRAKIDVTVNPKSGVPTVSGGGDKCQGDGAVTLSAPGSSNLIWFDVTNNRDLGSAAPTVTTGNAGLQTFRVSQDNNGCRSDQATVTVNVKPKPGRPTVTDPGAVCQRTPAPTLTAGGTFLKWYTAETGGNEVSNQVNTDSPGDKVYYVSQSDNGCTSDRAKITQAVKPASVNPAVTQPVLLCRGIAVGPITTAATGEGLRWYDSNNALLPNNGAAPTPPVGNVATILYRVSQTQTANGCESERVGVSVSVRNAPDAPIVTPVGLCQNVTPATSLSANVTGTSLSWYTTQTGGTGQPTPFVPNTAATGPQTFYVTQSIGTGSGLCEGPRAALTVTVFAVPAAPTVTAPPALCQNVVATNQSVVAAVATGTANPKWYETATSSVSSPAPATPTTTQADVQSYFVTQTTNNCESQRTKIDLTINAAPAPPTAPPASDLLRCQVDAARAVTATVAAGNTLRWYSTASGSSLPNPATGQSTAFTPPATVGVYTYYVTQTDGNGCQSLQQPISATIAATPSAPTVQAAQFACLNDATKQLTAQGINGTAFAWNGPNVTPDSPTAPTPPTSAATTLTYSVVQKLGTCTSPVSSIAYTVRPLPVPPIVSSNTGPGVQAACIGQNLTLQAVGVSGNTVRWYKTANLTDQPQNNPLSLPTTTPGNTTYYATQTDGNGCQSPATLLDVRVRTQAAATLTGDGTIIGYDSTAIRIRLSGDGPYTINLPAVGTAAAKTIVTSQNPYIWWVTPSFTLPGSNTASNGAVITRSSTYSISVSNDCGAGQIVAPYTLIVQTPLATNALGAEPIALKAYPNPTTGLVTIAWIAPEQQSVQVRVVSTQGHTVWQAGRTGTGDWQTEVISLGQYPAGQYILRITDDSTGTARLRVIKE